MRGFLERVAAIRESERLQALAEVNMGPAERVTHRITVYCKVCGAPISCWPSMVRKTCSQACRSIADTLPPQPCGYCGKPFKADHPGRRKFCSTTCASASMRKVTQ